MAHAVSTKPIATTETEPLAWQDGAAVSRRGFAAAVAALARHLPTRAFAVNLCADRYLFMVALMAAAVRGQTTLLPGGRIEPELAALAARYPDSHCLDDECVRAHVRAGAPSPGPNRLPDLDPEQVVAIAFTSGSTGRVRPHPKTWAGLIAGAWLAHRRFGFDRLAPATIVATVPPQHMYGLETSIMLPLICGMSVETGRPFFAEDVRRTLQHVPAPRVLVTTPAHLRVCADQGDGWPELALVISATAPLSVGLAARIERELGTRVMEIFGFTEAGSVASRRTVSEQAWTLYDGMTICDGKLVAPHLPEPIAFNDRIEARGAARFVFLGRGEDEANIAGKRVSLAFLNQVLCAIDGVEDGVFVAPQEHGDRPARLAAVVAAPGGARERILAALSREIDPVFMPRPLIIVQRLPRNDVGKLRREDLVAVMDSAGATTVRSDPTADCAGGGGGRCS